MKMYIPTTRIRFSSTVRTKSWNPTDRPARPMLSTDSATRPTTKPPAAPHGSGELACARHGRLCRGGGVHASLHG